MNIHKNARLTLKGREDLVAMITAGASFAVAARAFRCAPRTAAKWWCRFETEGRAGLVDRSSRPTRLRGQTPETVCAQIIALRRQRLTGQHIAGKTGVSPATVSRVLRRAGLSRIRDLEPAEPERRYERDAPGEMIHLDIKKLTRFQKVGHRITGAGPGRNRSFGAGSEYVHVCIDDQSRLAFTKIYPDQSAASAVAHLRAAVAWYASLGVPIERVMTDNGGCYRSRAFKAACTALCIRHIRTKPYTPRTNGKAERFIKTALTEWAYARAYNTSDQRAADLPVWTHIYNWHRPHGGIGSKPPISRLGLNRNNLLRLHT